LLVIGLVPFADAALPVGLLAFGLLALGFAVDARLGVERERA